MRRALAFVGLVLILTGCSSNSDKTDITVSAASSMTDSLWQLKEEFEEKNSNIQIHYNFGGSGSLRRQIEQGAPIDIFISASEKEYAILVDNKEIEKGSPILENKLVVVVPETSSLPSLEDFVNSNGKLAIGTPGAVPAGSYAKEALENMDVWESFDGRTVFAKDVRHVLTLVNGGSVAAGIVYASDLIKAEDLAVLEEINPIYHRSIQYYIAAVDQGEIEQDRAAAVDLFYEFLQSEASLSLFEQYGFELVLKEKLVND